MADADAAVSQDALRAVRLARHNASAWGYSTDRIAVVGHSADVYLAFGSAADPRFSAGRASEAALMILVYSATCDQENGCVRGAYTQRLCLPLIACSEISASEREWSKRGCFDYSCARSAISEGSLEMFLGSHLSPTSWATTRTN